MSDTLGSVDTEDTEEEIYESRLKSMKGRILRSRSNLNEEKDQSNANVRRSTRNKSQTYDNLNPSWIFGTQTLKGYPMYKQPDSMSEKDMEDEVSDRKVRIKSRMGRIPLTSRENRIARRSPIHLRDRSIHTHSNRQLRRSDRSLRNHDIRNRPQLREKILKNDVRSLKERQVEVDNQDTKESKEKLDLRTPNEDKEIRSRGRYATRLTNSFNEKDQKEEKSEQAEDADSSEPESDNEKQENNRNSENECYQDMYARVKRRRVPRKLPKRQMGSDVSDSSDTGPRKYSLRQKKPAVDRFQANVEPVRRSLRAFRSAFNTAIRMRRKRLKSSSSGSSSDSSDSEAQRYDKKKGKKSRQSAIPQGGPPGKKADITPISVDTNISFENVGGLESHIHCLKEMVVFPMMYPDIFDRFHISAPKGVLFHGPPGTGKTLIARALANECSQGSRKVSFFMRKGADCLSKWVGESERQLRLLFEQAQQMKPSIIFFDEIDGLAPVRSTKQDQIHASIVSTLLALMDGLNDRGEVIVIGATNRIDAIDPALRRPGRFDRELFFPLPAMKERLEILKIHVSKWKDAPSPQLLDILAEKSTGYSGSDLKALCTEAVIQGLKRTYPQIYKTSKRLLLNPERVEVKKIDFAHAGSYLIPSSQRVTAFAGRRLPTFMEPLLKSTLLELLRTIKGIFPQGTNPALAKMKTAVGIHRPRLLITGDNLTHSQGPRLAQALIYQMEHIPVHTLNISTLFAESARSPEETCVQVFNEAARNVPSIIYIRAIDQWWTLVSETVKAVVLCRLASLDPAIPILILATSDSTYEDLPDIRLKSLFSKPRGAVHSPNKPTKEQRYEFFKPIFLIQSLQLPRKISKNVEILEELPLAPDPLPKKLSVEEQKLLYDKEEISLRELRIFLREICAKLARNRQFFMFTKPVDTEEVPDYNEIIKQPMDLETMMTKIDMHRYLCARDFLDDIDLICRNALEYNPDRDPADKLIRHRACSLRDNAYALIKAELDSDFEDKCREISKTRKSQFEEEQQISNPQEQAEIVNPSEKKETNNLMTPTIVNGRRLPSSRKRRIPAWARGYLKKVQKKKKISFEDSVVNGGETTVAICKVDNNVEHSEGIDLEKFQEFEAEVGSIINGHVYDNTDTENDSQNESPKDSNSINKQDSSKKNSCEETMEVSNGDHDNIEEKQDNGHNSSVSKSLFLDYENTSFAINSDSSLECNETEENIEKVIVDKAELENVLKYTVDTTEQFPVELMCDAYVHLSRCVGRFARTYNRKSLPTQLLEQIKLFEEHLTTVNCSDEAIN